jgi:hypothetical protein
VKVPDPKSELLSIAIDFATLVGRKVVVPLIRGVKTRVKRRKERKLLRRLSKEKPRP